MVSAPVYRKLGPGFDFHLEPWGTIEDNKRRGSPYNCALPSRPSLPVPHSIPLSTFLRSYPFVLNLIIRLFLPVPSFPLSLFLSLPSSVLPVLRFLFLTSRPSFPLPPFMSLASRPLLPVPPFPSLSSCPSLPDTLFQSLPFLSLSFPHFLSLPSFSLLPVSFFLSLTS